MSKENVLPFAEFPMIPQAAELMQEYQRLSVEVPQAAEEYQSALVAKGVNFNQLVSVLSRHEKTKALSHLSDRLQTGLRAIDQNTEEGKQALERLVADTVTIWESRRD